MQEVLQSRYLATLSTLLLVGYLLAAVSGPLGLEEYDVLRLYPPFAGQWLQYLGLTDPIGSFFFWAILGIFVVTHLVRTSSWTGLVYLLGIAALVILVGMSKRGYSTDWVLSLKGLGPIEVQAGDTYEVGSQPAKGMKLSVTTAGDRPFVALREGDALYGLIAQDNKGDSYISVCRPDTPGPITLIFGLLGLLSVLIGVTLGTPVRGRDT